MHPTGDMAWVYHPEEYLDHVISQLRGPLAAPPQVASSGLTDALQLERHWSLLTDILGKVAEVNANTKPDRADEISIKKYLAKELLGKAWDEGLQAIRSPGGRAAIINSMTASAFDPQDLEDTVFWAFAGKPVHSRLGPLFRTAFTPEVWARRRIPGFQLLEVPSGLPNSPLRRRVVHESFSRHGAVVFNQTPGVVETFAALWDPANRDSTYESAKAALAAAEQLA